MISSSKKAQRTHNPIRAIVDNLNPPQNHPKKMLNLALGDPTVHGNLQCPAPLNENIEKFLQNRGANGYIPSVGLPPARKAIAQYNSTDEFTISEDDVIIASGCSGAIDLVLSAMLNEGDNILVPKPGFPLYQVITESLGGSVKLYPLKPELSWACDLEVMESLIDSHTKAIVINNPSNPCGSNFSPQHLRDIAAVARRHSLPIIADEIYNFGVFSGEFTPMHTLSEDVPVISFGGLAKEFVVPGWRVGWLIIHDRGGRLQEVKKGIKSLTQIVLGACALVQAAIPGILLPEPDSEHQIALAEFAAHYKNTLRQNAQLCLELLADCPALTVVEPKGAMYCMLRINIESLNTSEMGDDRAFAKLLLEEENLFVLPGQCFCVENFIRLVICPPAETMREACERLKLFCARHARPAGVLADAASTTSTVAAAAKGGASDSGDHGVEMPVPEHSVKELAARFGSPKQSGDPNMPVIANAAAVAATALQAAAVARSKHHLDDGNGAAAPVSDKKQRR